MHFRASVGYGVVRRQVLAPVAGGNAGRDLPRHLLCVDGGGHDPVSFCFLYVPLHLLCVDETLNIDCTQSLCAYLEFPLGRLRAAM